VRPELLDSFSSIGSFANQLHVGLMLQERGNPISEQRVVVDCQNPN